MPQLFAPNAAAVKTIVWGKLPTGKAGTAFKKPVKIAVTAKGSNGKPISGAYSQPITIKNSDNTGATTFFVNGKKGSSLKSSTDVLTMKYSGLAIVPATFTASSKSANKPAKATFKPTLTNIVYTGPTVTGPEIDLTSTTPATSGYSGAFTATQTGWTPSPYKKPFKYAFAAIAGFANNCPGTATPAFSVTPLSGKPGTAFTVTAAATAVAGECAMTLTGGGGKTLAVVLTFTTTSVGVNGRSAP
jgi:hypothetical protein